jgi:hypothetical protein
MDIGTSWKVARTALKSGGIGSVLGGYFSGMSMGGMAASGGRLAARNPSRFAGGMAMKHAFRAGEMRFGTGAMRVGAFGAGAALGLGLVSSTDVGRKMTRFAAPVVGGAAMYGGLKYGLNRWPKGIRGHGMATKYARGFAAMGGLGTWYGLS